MLQIYNLIKLTYGRLISTKKYLRVSFLQPFNFIYFEVVTKTPEYFRWSALTNLILSPVPQV